MPGASISKSASDRTPKCLPRRRCCQRSAPAWMRDCIRNGTGTNPEPEVVLVVTRDGRIVGASLGNDVNLRDFEGRSALLLSKAKDNNASCAIGPFVRFFDASFTLDDVRKMDISLEVKGPEGFVLHGASSLTQISRDPTDIVGQTINENHQYP